MSCRCILQVVSSAKWTIRTWVWCMHYIQITCFFFCRCWCFFFFFSSILRPVRFYFSNLLHFHNQICVTSIYITFIFIFHIWFAMEIQWLKIEMNNFVFFYFPKHLITQPEYAWCLFYLYFPTEASYLNLDIRAGITIIFMRRKWLMPFEKLKQIFAVKIDYLISILVCWLVCGLLIRQSRQLFCSGCKTNVFTVFSSIFFP